MGVEDLLQKHSLLESDIAIVGSRVKTINSQAQLFVDADFVEAQGTILIFFSILLVNILHATKSGYICKESSALFCCNW